MREQPGLSFRENQLAVAAHLEDAATRPNELGAGIGPCLFDSGLQLEGAWLIPSGIAEFDSYIQIGHIVSSFPAFSVPRLSGCKKHEKWRIWDYAYIGLGCRYTAMPETPVPYSHIPIVAYSPKRYRRALPIPIL